MLQYPVHVDNGSMYNTPPVFTIYVMRLVLKWLLKEGGLPAMGRRNAAKADKLYAEIDRTGFYRGHAAKDSRSKMNVTFRLPSEELEKTFARRGDRRRPRRPQGAPLGRRDARLDLQRVSRERRRHAGRVHEGVRAPERVTGRRRFAPRHTSTGRRPGDPDACATRLPIAGPS